MKKESSEEEENKKKPPLQRKRKDPNAPKRPKTAFMYFNLNMRPQIKNSNPNVKFGELSKLITDGWLAISEKDKLEYEKLAASSKAQYIEAKKKYDLERQEHEKESSEEEEKKKTTTTASS